MDKKVVFIVGASDGIGLEAAKQFAKKGYTVYNGSRNPAPSKYENIKNVILDVSYPEFCEDKPLFNAEKPGFCEFGGLMTLKKAVETILAEQSKIDIFVYSAGFSMAAPLEHCKDRDYRYLFEVNFFGFVKALKEIIPHMRKSGGGNIICVSSIGAIVPIAFDCFYSASKAAVNMLTEALALELKPFNIGVSAVMPGGTATGFTEKRKVYPADEANGYEENLKKAVAALAELEQTGMEPEKVAETIVKTAEMTDPPHIVSSGLQNKTIAMMKKLLPKEIIEAVTEKVYLE